MIPGIVASGGSSAPAGAYLDDLATGPVAVWSLDKLISTATLAIRVRRSSGGEQDIGFTGDALNTSDLATFVGSDSAYIVKVYDQAGSNPLEMATAGSQPRIVNAGTYQDGWTFDGSNDVLASASALTMGTPRVWLFAQVEQTTDVNVKVLFELSADYGAAADRFIFYDYSPQGGLVASMGAVGSTRAEYFINAGGMAQWTITYDRSLTVDDELKAYRDGSEQTGTAVPGSSTEQTGTFGSHILYVGARSGAALPSTSKMRTLAVYTADVSSLQTAIEAIVS